MREVIERLHVRKNALSPSLVDLRAAAEVLEQEIEGDETAVAELETNAALLGGDEAAGLANLYTLLPVKRRKLTALTVEIDRAERREALGVFEANRLALDRATAKAAKTYRQRYEKATGELVALLQELRDNHENWEAIAHRGRELGVVAPGGKHLESRVRGDQLTGATARLLWPDTILFGWNGVPLWKC